MRGRNVEAELFRRIIKVGDQRQVGDGRLRTKNVMAAGEALVDDAEGIVDAALEKFHHRRMAGGLGKIAQEAIRPEKAVDLLIVENDPAQRFEPLVLAARQEFFGVLGEIGQDHAGLGQLLAAVNEHRDFAHLVDVAAPLRRALHALAEEVDEHRLPIGADQIEHQRGAVGVAGLGEAVELIFGHVFPAMFVLR